MGIPAWTQPSGYRLNRIIEKEKMIMGITLARIDNRLLHGIVASQEDLEAYKAIASYKVPVRIQYVPADKEIPLESVVEI